MNKKTINKKNMNWRLLIILIVVISATSCRKLVEAPIPSEQIADENVYSTDATAIAVLGDIYIRMNAATGPFQNTQSINMLAGLSADELTPHRQYITSGNTSIYYLYYSNNLSQSMSSAVAGSEQWSRLYNFIFKTNAAIEGLNSSIADKLTPGIRNQLIGEAKFLRAFYYFYLVNMFGDVPLALTTDPDVNRTLHRATKDVVYQQIISDLKESEELLADNFVALSSGRILVSTERVRPTKWAAAALLARVYLYTQQFDKAEVESSNVINNNSLFGPLPALNSVFLKNSREAIWQLQPTDQYYNTYDARAFVIPAAGPQSSANPVNLSKKWLNNFELNDKRSVLGNWINRTIYNLSPTVLDTVYYPFKYKKYLQDLTIVTSGNTQGYTKMTEYFMVLRLGEQYLIRAEARAHLGNTGGAQSDLNAIRTRAGLGPTAAGDQTSLLTAILKERQVELFCEWGNRWFDLKRTNNIDAVMTVATPLKSNGNPQWRPYQALYPLPISDLFLNNIPNAYLTQNPGY